MSQHEIKFYDNQTGIPFVLKSWRSFQYTYNKGKSANSVIRLDKSASALKVQEGWEIEIYRNGQIRFYGRVNERTVKDQKITIKARDPIGLLSRKRKFQRPVTVREASVEVQTLLDGIKLGNRMTLSAKEFLQVTGTSLAYHWEHNPLSGFIKSIGEETVDLAGNKIVWDYWIDPVGNVYFGADGQFGTHHVNLGLKKLTFSSNIDSTFNKITVEGNPIITIPYDGDLWTESVPVGSWESAASQVDTFELTATPNVGGFHLQGISAAVGLVSWRRSVLAKDGIDFNFENAKRVDFWVKWTTPAAGVMDVLQFVIEDKINELNRSWLYSSQPHFVSFPTEGTWEQIYFDLTVTPDSQSATTAPSSIFIGATESLAADLVLSIDGLRISLDPYSYLAEDNDSKEAYGDLEKLFVARNFYSNAECQTFAEKLLAYYKDAKIKLAGSIDGFKHVTPLDIISQEFEGVLYTKPIRSVTYSVAIDGSETTNIVMGDFFKDSVDLIEEKLAEINTNYHLLEFPYKTA